ncbi:MAG: FliH/SctL family protein [Bryobacteraceae bacterium]
MSSRLFSGGDNAPEVAPILWRSAGSAAPVQGGMRRAGAQPHPEESVEARVHAAYNRGVADGEATAQQRAGTLAAPVLANFGAIVRDLAGARANARQEAEESMVKLALAVARRVLHREMATDPTAILGLIRSAFDRLNAREIHKLRLSPGDAQIVLENRADLAIPQAIEIYSDAGLAPGSALFETSRGELDLSVQTQLEEIERGFTDLVAQRKR